MNCSSLDQVSVLPTVPNYMNYSSLHQVSGMPHLNCHSLSAVPQSSFYPFRQTSTLMHQVISVHPNPSFESYAHRNSVDQNPFAVIANTGSYNSKFPIFSINTNFPIFREPCEG
ncbi:hypothetical protein ACOSQ4_008747 [Xanthoceras sorbifolium]